MEGLLQQLSATNDDRLHILLTGLTVARNAGSIVQDAFYKMKNVKGKDCLTDLVTETDKAVENIIFASLKKEFPSHCFIGEESASEGAAVKLTDEPTWIVDPIDGTTNFVHMNPNVAVCIGFVRNKRTEVGLVFAPMLGDMYVGVRGCGAWCNDKRLLVQDPVPTLSRALVACEWGAGREEVRVNTVARNFIDVLLKHGIHGLRCTGSAALNMCLVATNAVDLYFEWGPHCWDFAASSLIVEEAGGVNSTTHGTEFDLMARTIISATSRGLIDELVPTLTQIPTARDDE
jgi:myo-inositol-1(or 4)-monophosphatase